MDINQIIQTAKVCHEANKAFCQTIGDNSQKSWEEAEHWQRESAVNGVKFALSGEHSASAQHDAWCADKTADGWKYGPIKDADKKEHPCLVAYSDLPTDQRLKDHLFRAIVRAFQEAD